MPHRLALLGMAVLAGVVLGGSAGAQGGSAVDVRDNDFVPADLVVTVGEPVQWTQSGTNPHSITADDGSFDSHPNCPPDCMGQGDTFSRTFDAPGEHAYYCKIHGGPGGQGMSGVISVQSPEQEPTSPTTEATTTSTTAEAVPTSSTSAPTPTTAAEEVAAGTADTAQGPAELPNTGAVARSVFIAGVVILAGGAAFVRLGRRVR